MKIDCLIEAIEAACTNWDYVLAQVRRTKFEQAGSRTCLPTGRRGDLSHRIPTSTICATSPSSVPSPVLWRTDRISEEQDSRRDAEAAETTSQG